MIILFFLSSFLRCSISCAFNSALNSVAESFAMKVEIFFLRFFSTLYFFCSSRASFSLEYILTTFRFKCSFKSRIVPVVSVPASEPVRCTFGLIMSVMRSPLSVRGGRDTCDCAPISLTRLSVSQSSASPSAEYSRCQTCFFHARLLSLRLLYCCYPCEPADESTELPLILPRPPVVVPRTFPLDFERDFSFARRGFLLVLF